MKIPKLVPAIGICAICVSFGSVQAQDNPAQAAARAALMKQMDQVQAPEPETPSPTPAPTMPKTPAPVAPAPAAAPVMITPTPAPSATMTSASPVPIVAPAIPISATKEQRLQALLAKYKADQITPEQYHTQRAEILAEP
jgi:hypothetical protein